MSVEIKLGDIGFNHPAPTREFLEDAADREDDCGGIVTAGSMDVPRDCMDCGTCHDCIIRTMESAHESELAALRDELARVREQHLVIMTGHDCTWGIGSGRHCTDDKPCKKHQLAAAVAERDAMRVRYEEAVGLLRKAQRVIFHHESSVRGEIDAFLASLPKPKEPPHA